QRRCHARIRPLGAERQMARPFLGYDHRVCEETVEPTPLLLRCFSISDGRMEGMDEQDAVSLQLDDPGLEQCGQAGSNPFGITERPLEQLNARRMVRRDGSKESVASGR